MPPRPTRVRWDEIALRKVTEMVSEKTVAGAELELVQMYFKKGTLVPLHRHDTERLVYVLQGVIRVVVEGEDLTVREGEVLILAPGATHQAEVLDDTFLMVAGKKPGFPESHGNPVS